MADTDSTRSSAPDERGADDDGATQPEAPAGATAVPAESGVAGVAQRHNLPMRRAATLPAAVRDHDGDHDGPDGEWNGAADA
ncbi:hypothetical protein GM708_17195, partial [Vibrio cholerae]|nr:hypothetical protein [Vibrio cholerae]